MAKSYRTRNVKETRALARALASEVLRTRRGASALTIALVGALGAGKTTFVQSFVRALAIKQRVTSPTFLIIRRFPISKKGSVFSNVFHIDAFRARMRDMKALGAEDILHNPGNIVLVEWADRIRAIIPKGAIWVLFEHDGERERHITFDRR